MSFQAYLDAIEAKTSLTPRQLIVLAHEHGLDVQPVQAGLVIDWLKADYGLGRGHAMALVHVLKPQCRRCGSWAAAGLGPSWHAHET